MKKLIKKLFENRSILIPDLDPVKWWNNLEPEKGHSAEFWLHPSGQWIYMSGSCRTAIVAQSQFRCFDICSWGGAEHDEAIREEIRIAYHKCFSHLTLTIEPGESEGNVTFHPIGSKYNPLPRNEVGSWIATIT